MKLMDHNPNQWKHVHTFTYLLVYLISYSLVFLVVPDYVHSCNFAIKTADMFLAWSMRVTSSIPLTLST
jgi:hypothetical protein